MKLLSPKDILRKAYLREKVKPETYEAFVKAYTKLTDTIDPTRDEEHNKAFIRDFLKDDLGYKGVNTSGRADLAIYKDKIPEVIIEVKRPTNKSEMVSIDKPNVKSFHEALLYFMRETRKERNQNIRNIIITNGYEWYVFDAYEFNKVASHKQIEKVYKDAELDKILFTGKTKDIYKYFEEIIQKNDLLSNLQGVRFHLQEKYTKTQMIHLYKLLSHTHLLKEEIANDANTLNKPFYDELLHILGLEEKKQGGKKLIQRKEPKSREDGSMLENTIGKLQSEFQLSDEAELFEIALELNITWLNRLLFLKLLEAKLVKVHRGEYEKFLIAREEYDFDMLNSLFFDVLAVPVAERRASLFAKFKDIPYLNSSLFTPTPLEQKYLRISNLRDNVRLSKHSKSIVGHDDEMNTLQHLLRFLDAYDFGSSSDDELVGESKALVNSAVLGLIFEKLNGYKDGSFYTPSFITMYMAKQTLRSSMVQKFNEAFGIGASDFEELKAYSEAHFYKKEYKKKANEVINGITVVDPAVGSGHFLVSALNELLTIKSELKIIDDLSGYAITNENDELYVETENGFFEYVQSENGTFSTQDQKIQEKIFHEKLSIIENQLFGVDINPNSAKITRLRLWIELLKHSYYDEHGQLVTMPNIDINIKQGNSLISKYEQNAHVIGNEFWKRLIQDYKDSVYLYKRTSDKAVKQEIDNKIKEIKLSFPKNIEKTNDVKKFEIKLKKYVEKYKYSHLNDEIVIYAMRENIKPQSGFFDEDDEKPRDEKLVKEINDDFNLIEDNPIYKDAFEWRFQFPEVLDEEGNFVGFDVVIGNPPYIMEDDNRLAFGGLHDKPCYQGKTDIWHLFTCRGLSILKEEGLLSYIAKNQWMESVSASNMRRVIYDTSMIHMIVDFGTNMIFEEASQQTMLFVLEKSSQHKEHNIEYMKFVAKMSNNDISKFLNEPIESDDIKITQKILPKNYGDKENLTFSSSKHEEILSKIEQKKNFEFDEKEEIIQGIIGGPDKAFIVSQEELQEFDAKEKEYFQMLHTSTGRYYTPDTQKYICYIAKHNCKDKEIEDYPNIENMLLPYKSYKDEKGKQKGLKHRREVVKGGIDWFHLWWARNESFFKEGAKIIFASRTKGKNFTYTDELFYGSRNLFFIKSNRINLKYITALLNSNLMYFYMNERLKHTGDLLQIDKNQFMKIPLYVPNNTGKFDNLVDSAIQLKKQNKETSELETQIDAMVYTLYGLSEEEIAVVEGATKE